MATKRKRNTISQAEARRLRTENDHLTRERDRMHNRWARDFPGGVNIAQQSFTASTDFLPAVVGNSRLLGHAVVVVNDGAKLLFFALPLPK